MITRETVFVGGEWRRPKGSSWLEVVSPATELAIGRAPEADKADVDEAVATAREAFRKGPWPRMTVRERGDALLELASALAPLLSGATDLQIDEMGSPRRFMEPMTMGLVANIKGEIEAAERVSLVEERAGMVGPLTLVRSPIGVVAAIIPWNAPLYLVVSKMIPSLLMGCPIVIKTAPETPLSAYVMAEAITKVGLPAGVVSIISGGRDLGEYLVSHSGVDRVTFTGSTAAGRKVAAVCAEQMKSCTLELGGKSAAVLLEDADLDRFVPTIVENAMRNNGQVCVATTRILVPRHQHDGLVDRLVSCIDSMRVGDPRDLATDIGPLVAERQRDRVEQYIAAGRVEGAKTVIGGGRPPLDRGWYVEPTLFVAVDKAMRIAQEEIFGPVACVIAYDGEGEAISIANDSRYGLAGSVYSQDLDRGCAIAARLETGTCALNDAPLGGGGGPSGGWKGSGRGREHDVEGLNEFLNLKVITHPRPADWGQDGAVLPRQTE